MGMMNGNGGRRAVKSDLNITPMVDVVFVLLIIFMVAAPMIEQGVDLDLPQTETVPIESPKDKFIIRVFKGKKEANNQIFIDKTAVPIDDLEEKLKTNERIKSEKEVFLHASKELSYGYVVRVMAIMKKAGVNSISLVTEPLEGEK
ncbi:MAG TPA: biopolymer transporter ExbD [bacterium]|nr:biopolymer transporter ExbD [bacterium]